VKPGRSAADFLKRRQSYESQEIEERCSTSSGDGSEALNEVFEEDFDENESVFSPNTSTDSFRNKSLSNTGIICCRFVIMVFAIGLKKYLWFHIVKKLGSVGRK
jgi:hypothetical protein